MNKSMKLIKHIKEAYKQLELSKKYVTFEKELTDIEEAQEILIFCVNGGRKI